MEFYLWYLRNLGHYFFEMKKILDFIVYSNFFIALCCAAITLQTAIIFKEVGDSIYEYVLINFIATFVLYNLQRLYYSSKIEDEEKYIWYANNRRLIFTLIILVLLLSFNFIWQFFIENKFHIVTYSILAILSLFYFLPPFQLKKFGVLKPFLIGLVFVFVSVLIPSHLNYSFQCIYYGAAQLCFICSLCILFDIRDMVSDKSNGINTIPVLFGIQSAKIISMILMAIYLMFSFFIAQFFLLALIIVGLMLGVILLTSERRNNYFYLIVVDGLIIAQFLIIKAWFNY